MRSRRPPRFSAVDHRPVDGPVARARRGEPGRLPVGVGAVDGRACAARSIRRPATDLTVPAAHRPPENPPPPPPPENPPPNDPPALDEPPADGAEYVAADCDDAMNDASCMRRANEGRVADPGRSSLLVRVGTFEHVTPLVHHAEEDRVGEEPFVHVDDVRRAVLSALGPAVGLQHPEAVGIRDADELFHPPADTRRRALLRP